MIDKWFSLTRLWGMVTKEFIQIIRDKHLIGMLAGIPLVQIILFGYAIDLNPRNLPTMIVTADHSQFTRAFIQGMHNTDYFDIIKFADNQNEAKRLLQLGEIKFAVYFPPQFSRDLIRSQQPQILIETDATDPSATSNAISTIRELTERIFQRELSGSLSHLQRTEPVVDLIIQRKYNPASITQYNIVPGLIGVILTMTMVMITAMAITRERERGTMETLLSTPVKPIEVMLGKITPYVLIGYMQTLLTLFLARLLFTVPLEGSIVTLLVATLPFIVANLTVGVTISTLVQNQLQSLQLSIFFFLPSILLSGFMFPFAGMPDWAQVIGNMLPLTHYLLIIRGIMLKGNSILDIWPHIWPIVLFIFVTLALALKRYRRTLD